MSDAGEPTPDGPRHRAPNGVWVAAGATVAAAVIGGVFSLAATGNSGSDTPSGSVQTVLPPLTGNDTAAPLGGPGGTSTSAFLSDLTPTKAPSFSDIADTVGGRAIIKVIGVGSNETAEYAIPPDAKSFAAYLGVSDGHGTKNNGSSGTFFVYGDTTLLGQTHLEYGRLAVFSVPVKGYKTLRVGFTSTDDLFAVGDFGEARFTS